MKNHEKLYPLRYRSPNALDLLEALSPLFSDDCETRGNTFKIHRIWGCETKGKYSQGIISKKNPLFRSELQ